MAFDAERAAYLHLCADGAGTRICVTGTRELALHWGTRARPAEIEAQLLQLVERLDEVPVLLYDTRALVELLSRSGLSEAASGLRARLRDVQAATLIVQPALQDPSLRAAGEALEAGDDRMRYAAADDPAAGASLCRELTAAVRERLARMHPAPLALVRELLLADIGFSWLDLEGISLPQIEDGALEMLVAGRPGVPDSRPRERAEVQTPLPVTAAGLLEEGGPIAEALDQFASRSGQIEMAGGVAEAMEDGGVLMVEAGTGVGKTFAYLIPAILWARAHADRVVVSTNTKNLQEQLVGRDLPFLRRCLDLDFEAALLKGRANYLCVRRFLSRIRDALGSMMQEDRRAAAYLVSWFSASDSCDLTQIPAEARHSFNRLGGLIQQVRSDRATCLGPGCRHARHCPLRVARARARNADIVVSNHALTLADTQYDVLPKTSRIIFDEAHNLESVATDQLGYEVSSFSFWEIGRTLGDEGKRRGVLDGISRYLDDADPHRTDAIAEAQARLNAASNELQPLGEELGAAVTNMCVALDREAAAGRARLRLGAGVYETRHWREVAEAGERVLSLLQSIAEALRSVSEELREERTRPTPQSDLAMEASGALGAVAELDAALGAVFDDKPGAGYVLWAETARRRRGDLWRLCAAPIDVGPALQRAVYDRRDSVVMTSATLTVDGSFDFMRQRLGLDTGEVDVRELIVPSPFRYREQLLMCVPEDIPTRGEEGREDALAEALLDIAGVAGGGVLLLFTSRAQMDRVFERIAPRLADGGLSPICQYTSGPRSWLLHQLRERGNTVLFGLKSFWEGVDVPGKALRCVVIVKLPFSVPTDPIVESRCELAANRGPDGGSDYYIPEAILGFKQGIGRLIRSVTDEGVVFVLDNRLITRRYGQRFFASIPECRFQMGGFHECLQEAERWLR